MDQVFENIKVLQLPPNPNEFDITCRSVRFSKWVTGIKPICGIGC